MGTNLEKFCWGTKEKLHESDFLLIDKLNIVAGGFSSIHYHCWQSNEIIIISGILDIEYYLFDIINPCFINSLVQNDREHIKPFNAHRFKATSNVVAIEIIHSTIINQNVSREDIIRLTERGIENAQK